jgi:Chaperone of endosialidase
MGAYSHGQYHFDLGGRQSALRVPGVVFLFALLAMVANAAHAAACPFDTPGTSLTREGLVLSRYALGLTGAPLVANTGFSASDATTIQNNIVALTDQLDINRNGSIDVTDTTIIARKIAGYSNAAATAGLPPTSLGPGGASAVNSFLLSGCGNNAWQIGGNAITSDSLIGTTSAFSLQVSAGGPNISLTQGGGHGLRVSEASGVAPLQAPNVVNGSAANELGPLAGAAVIAGGGDSSVTCYEPSNLSNTRPCRNYANNAGSTVAGGLANIATEPYSTVSGGASNTANAQLSTVSGGENNVAEAEHATVGGGLRNRAGGVSAVVVGGQGNKALGVWSTVVGGSGNTASESFAIAVGGVDNRAGGTASLAAGANANASTSHSFVWGGSPNVITNDRGVGTFTAYAPGGFFFLRGAPNIGGGCVLPEGTASWSCTSDRNAKTNISALNTRETLHKVLALPLARWSYKGTESIRNIGPMAQDFWAAFRLGESDKTIASMNMSGVALAAIQGLNQKLADEASRLRTQLDKRDEELSALRAELHALRPELAAIKRKLGMN